MTQRFVHWFTAVAFLVTSGVVLLFLLFFYYGRGLPDYEFLHHYEPVALNRVYASDSQILREFAQERRIYARLHKIPTMLINSFLVAEDKNFYTHCGLDIPAIVRAIVSNSTQGSWHSRPLGGSTITQQVAKNFLVGNAPSFKRKIEEAIMSLRLESALRKERILELYLNEIYLGMGSYGVVAAALTYFNKNLNELSIAEMAFLAALPKAPSFYPNQKDLSRAIARRNWVIDRLQEEGFLSGKDAHKAKQDDLVFHSSSLDANQPTYETEYVRQELLHMVDQDTLTKGGLTIKTTFDPALQKIAMKALKQGLIDYDRRHGWREPIDHIDLENLVDNDWRQALKKIKHPAGLGSWKLAVVLTTTDTEVLIGLENDKEGSIPLKNLSWAQKNLPDQRIGSPVVTPQDVLQPGDVVVVSWDSENFYRLEQIPEVTGGIVALDPHTGHVLAMVGGYDFSKSQYNCVTQAKRQPGSAFKPFVYLTALENGYTPETRILDAPLMVNVGGKMGVYAPQNITKKFYGPTSLQSGLIYSRNVMTVRLAQQIGIRRIERTARKFGIVEKLPSQLAMALGAAETTLLKLTTAYGMIANGGYEISPLMINQVVDRHHKVIYEAPTPFKKQIASPQSIHHLVKMMEGVIQKGTAQTLVNLDRPIAGKTGSTNDFKDSWFVGFTPDLVVGVFVGFASPRTLGENETGAKVALPIFHQFMTDAMNNKPVLNFKGL